MGHHRFIVAIALAVLACHFPQNSTSLELRDPDSFLKQCLRIRDYHFDSELRPPNVVVQQTAGNAEKCLTYSCFGRHRARDLRHLNRLGCKKNQPEACMSNESSMICRDFQLLTAERTVSLCDCPRGQAYNPFLCRCQYAEPCGDNQPFCLNGMKCSDQFCSCGSMESKLVDPHSQLCVETSSSNETSRAAFLESPTATAAGSSGSLTAMIVIVCLISIVIVVLITLIALQTCQGFCDRGQYVCDEDDSGKNGAQNPAGRKQKEENPHVAAWDLPGLDYLSEEQTMKYLNRGQPSPPVDTSTPNNSQPLRRMGGTHHIDQAGSQGSGSSPSPSACASLPESDRFEAAAGSGPGAPHDVVNRRADGVVVAGNGAGVAGGNNKLMASKTNSVETVQSHIL